MLIVGNRYKCLTDDPFDIHKKWISKHTFLILVAGVAGGLVIVFGGRAKTWTEVKEQAKGEGARRRSERKVFRS